MNYQALYYCRPGFEKDLAAELMHHSALASCAGYCKVHQELGLVSFYSESKLDTLLQDVIFARQSIFDVVELKELPDNDRITPILRQLETMIPDQTFQDIVLESPDTNEGKSLSRFLKKFIHPLAKALKSNGFTKAHGKDVPFIHICFLDYKRAFVGLSYKGNRSPFPGGIRRLKFPKDGPSRSTLKLEEAFFEFGSIWQEKHQKEGLTAVDLGAAPGGWTYQLVKRGMFTYAVDNGPMNPDLMASGLVEHCQEDAYKFHPRGPVDLLVCDMVDKPSLVTELIKSWFQQGWCHNAIFNLKLPMKKRFEEVNSCLESLRAVEGCHVLAKHLFHDREEITVYMGS